MIDCPVCYHPHLDYQDEACVSCGCDLRFMLDWDDKQKARLVAALVPDYEERIRADERASLRVRFAALTDCEMTSVFSCSPFHYHGWDIEALLAD